jgi:hypothetical protein
VYLPWFSKGIREIKTVLPFVENNASARTIINYCAEREGFRCLEDFSLVYYFNGKRYVLDDDEYVIDVAKWMKGEKAKEEGERKTFFDQLSHFISWGHGLEWNQEAKLRLEKIYYFPKVIE